MHDYEPYIIVLSVALMFLFTHVEVVGTISNDRDVRINPKIKLSGVNRLCGQHLRKYLRRGPQTEERW